MWLFDLSKHWLNDTGQFFYLESIMVKECVKKGRKGEVKCAEHQEGKQRRGEGSDDRDQCAPIAEGKEVCMGQKIGNQA